MKNQINPIPPAPAPAVVSPQIVAPAATVPPKARKKPAVLRAAERYIRQRDRIEPPDGGTDNAGRWYPEASEQLDTRRYRYPSRTWPWSYMVACRTIAHCAKLEGIPEKVSDGRKGARRLDREAKLLNQGGKTL